MRIKNVGNESRGLRVVFPMLAGGWLGGINYFMNLLETVLGYAPEIDPLLLKSSDAHSPATIGQCQQYVLPDRNRFVSLLNRGSRRIAGYDFVSERALQIVQADTVFSANPYVGRSCPAIYWIADFQHVRMPDMFLPAEIRGRDRAFHTGAKQAALVVLSSTDALNDFQRELPQYAHKGRLMHFVSNIPKEIYEIDPGIALAEYHLPSRFFYLPNQFWRHKNHLIVFEALYIIKSRGIRPVVVCTGSSTDYRHGGWFTELKDKIADWELTDQVKFLGIVPKPHVHQLIRQSICLINPSLFEGWNTGIEEAKSIGKRVIASDIAVHREQNAPETLYFDPHDANDLAQKMITLWTDQPPGPDYGLESQALQTLDRRLAKFAANFVTIACEAAKP